MTTFAALKLVLIVVLADGSRLVAPTDVAQCAEWAARVSSGERPLIDNEAGEPQLVIVALCVPEDAARLAAGE